jgi:uncharacterized membrane protein YbhN (UPF0104 family)
VIMAIPLFPGGAGIAELGFGILFGWFGASQSLGITATLLNRLSVWIVAGGCFGVYLTSTDMKEAASHSQGDRTVDPDNANQTNLVESAPGNS